MWVLYIGMDTLLLISIISLSFAAIVAIYIFITGIYTEKTRIFLFI
jgi:hypothetical protein